MIILITWVVACSNDNDPDMTPIPEEERIAIFFDSASIKSITLNLLNQIPTWEQLERFTDVAQRLPLASFEKGASSWAGLPGDDDGPFDTSKDWMPQVLEYSEYLTETFGGHETKVGFNDVPPFTAPDGSRNPVPYPLDILDQKLRASTALLLYEKSQGRPTTFVNFYPPDVEIEKFSTETQFYAWLDNEYLPEKEAEARAAELMKAEKYIPWPLEFEIFIAEVGGIHDDGFLANSTEQQILDFANDVKARIFNAVKANYNGKIVAHLHNNYQRAGFDYWDQMTYGEFDEIHFSFFPPFDVASTNAYMDELLLHNAKIVRNSGNIPWIANDVSVFEWYVEDGKLLEYEKDMYEAALNKLEGASIPPKGISAAGGYMKTDAARNYLREFFASR